MKESNQKLYAGVWMDNEKALIIADAAASGDYALQHTVKAKANRRGGSEHAMNNAQKTHALQYYKSISTLLMNYDGILIFGPGKSQEEFQHHLQKDPQFKGKQIAIDSAEQLTDPQMIAKVRDFFKSRPS